MASLVEARVSRDGASPQVVIAGGGPAGLSAALALARAGRSVIVVEREEQVGGLARTIERNGYRFDLGGHRFFTRHPEVRALWDAMLGSDLQVRHRRSRILFRGHAYDYPLTARSALAGLGAVEAARIAASYLRARLGPTRPEISIADWFVNRFGRRLFETFFRPYTEKVWGLPCESIGAQWAAQRIRGLSLRTVIADLLHRGSGGQRTLVTEFLYPRLGPGMLWERMREQIEAMGSRVLVGHRLVGVHLEGSRVGEVEVHGPHGRTAFSAGHLVSTIPLRDLAAVLTPAPPRQVATAAQALRYRDFIEVALVLEGVDPFPDTWVYLHDPAVRAGRIQNYRAWSPELVPRADRSCLGLEYFCSAGDALWSLPDEALVAQAEADLASLGLGPHRRVVEAHVVRVRDAYPVYRKGFDANVAVLRSYADTIPNLIVAGRNGMHRYDNMDHAMLTGMLAARNVLGEHNDLWSLDTDEDAYLEPPAVEASASAQAGSAGRK